MRSFDRAHGCLALHAVGDALGAPTENLSRAEIRRRYGAFTDFLTDDPAGTDDTEFAVLTAWLELQHGHELTSMPAITGALAGALEGGTGLPASWREALDPVRGVCLPFLAGASLRTSSSSLLRAAGAEGEQA